nr:protein bassoon-like [Oncorhynchus nerka]
MASVCMPLSPSDLEIDCDLLLVSKAYHLGQEETDWFEKPRDLRSSSRHYGSGGHSSSGRSRHVKHTYHDYDEPPEEDLWPQDEYGHSRQSSTSRDHRHHGSTSSGRHSASSRHSDEPRTSRSSKGHPKDPSMRHDSRQMSSSGKRGDPRSQGGYHSSDYSRDPSGHHHSQGRSSKSSSSHDGRTSSRKQQELQGHPPSSSRGQGSSGRVPGSTGGPPGSRGQGPTSQQDGLQQGQRTQLQQQPQTLAARQTGTTPAGTTPGGQQPLGLAQAQQGLQAKPGQLGPGQAGRQPQAGGPLGQLPLTAQAPVANTPPVTAIGAKAVIGGAAQPAKTPQPPLTGIGSKAAPRPSGIGSAATGQPGMEGDSLLSKVLPGNPAEAAGKLGEAISGFGKKFTSLW